MAFPLGRARNGSFQFQAAVERWREGEGASEQVAGKWPSIGTRTQDAGRRTKKQSLGLQLKAEKVIYFVLRFLTTFSTLYNSNDSRKLQLPSSFLSPWLYKFYPAQFSMPPHSLISPWLSVPVPLSAR